MMIEALDKLRRSVCGRGWSSDVVSPLLGMIDDVEKEVERDCIGREEFSERYIERPVDADGVPWTGDEGKFVDGYGNVHDLIGMRYYHDEQDWILTYLLDADAMEEDGFFAGSCRHFKPDPVKELLREFGENVARQGHQAGLVLDDMATHYAAKLHEAMGGDACDTGAEAIAARVTRANLGSDRKKCSMEKLQRWFGDNPAYRCDTCGYENYEPELPCFCPGCGRKVRDD